MTVLANLTMTSTCTFPQESNGGISAETLSDATFDTTSAAIVNVTGNYRLYNLADDTIEVFVRIVDGATILAAADAGGTYQSFMGPIGPNDASYTTTVNAPIPAPWDTFSFNYVNPSATQTNWNNAQIVFQQTYTRNMGGDGGYFYFQSSNIFVEVANTNRDVICTTEALTFKSREASVSKFAVGDTVAAVIAQSGTSAVTGATGWVFEEGVSNSTVRLEVWSRTLTGSDNFNWTIPNSDGWVHYLALPPNYNIIDYQTMTSGTGTTIDTPLGNAPKKYAKIGSYFVADADAGAISMDTVLDVVEIAADNDDYLAMGGGHYFLPLGVWVNIGNHPYPDDIESSEGFGRRGDFIQPGGGRVGGGQQNNTYFWDGVQYNTMSTMPTNCRYAGACGTSSAAGVVTGGNTNASYATTHYLWNGSTWSSPVTAVQGSHYSTSFGSSTSLINMWGYYNGNPILYWSNHQDFNGTAYSVGATTLVSDNHVAKASGTYSAGYATGGAIYAGANYDLNHHWNGTAWSAEAVMLTTRAVHSTGGTQTSAIVVAGSANGNVSNHNGSSEAWNGSTWETSIPLNTSKWDHSGDGANSGSHSLHIGDGLARAGFELYSGPQAPTHTIGTSQEWVGVTISAYTDIPRDVVCATEAITVGNGYAAVGRNVFQSANLYEAQIAGNTALFDKGIVSFPVLLTETGGINGTTEALILAGTPATIQKDFVATGITEALELGGSTATVLLVNTINGVTGANLLTGTPATVVQGQSLEVTCTTGAIVMAGNGATLVKDKNVPGITEALELFGTNAQISKSGSKEVSGQIEALVLTENQGTVGRTREVVCQPEAIVLTSAPVGIDWDVIALPEALTLTGTAATVGKQLGRTILANTGAIGLRAQFSGDNIWMKHRVRHLFSFQGPHGWTGDDDADTTNGPSVSLNWNDAESVVFGGGKHRDTTFRQYRETGTTWAVTNGTGVYYDIQEKLFDYSTIRFTGDGSYLQSSFLSQWNMADHFQWVGWIKPDTVVGTQCIFSSVYGDGGWECVLDGNELNVYGYTDAGVLVLDTSTESPVTTLVGGQWYWILVSMSFDQTTLTTYIGTPFSGVPVLDKTKVVAGGTIDPGPSGLKYGQRTAGQPDYFTGYMTDMALSPTRWTSTIYVSPEGPMWYGAANGWDNDLRLNTGSVITQNDPEWNPTIGAYAIYIPQSSDFGIYDTNGSPERYTALHRLDGSWTLEMRIYFEDISVAQNIWSTACDLPLQAGLQVTLNTDLSIRVEVRRFNQSNALDFTTATSLVTYGVPMHLELDYHNPSDTMTLRKDGVIVGSAQTIATPDTSSLGAEELHVGPHHSQGDEDFQGAVCDYRYTFATRYAVGENMTPPPAGTLTNWYQVVRTDRELITTASEALVLTGNPAVINSTPARTIGADTEALVLTGNAATVDKITDFPRNVTGATGNLQLGGSTAGIDKGRDAIGASEALLVGGSTAGIEKDRLVTGATEALSFITGFAQVFKGVDRDINGATEALLLGSNNATIITGRGIIGTTESLVMSGNQADVGQGRAIQGTTAAIVVTGTAANAQTDRDVSGTVEFLEVASVSATVGQGRTITTTQAANELGGSLATLNRGRDVTGSGGILIDGNTAIVEKGLFGVVIADPEALVLTANRAHVDHMTIANPLPRYDRIGVKVLNPEAAPNNLFSPSEGVSLVTKGASKLSPPVPESDP